MRRAVVMAAGTIALAGAAAAPAVASAPHAGGVVRHFVEHEAGTRLSISDSGLRAEDVFRVKTGPFGGGAVVRDLVQKGTVFPISATAIAHSFYKDGRLISSETLTYGAPRSNGTGTITGNGTCTGGTFKHQHETCTYTIRGNYNLKSDLTFLTLAGTYTPPATVKKKRQP